MQQVPVGSEDTEDTFRGYKYLEDGRKTSFFHNEMTAETRSLIGDITPKQIDMAKQVDVAAGSSAWNAAGTFESRDWSPYADAKLRSLLVSRVWLDDGGQVLATLTAVESLVGDASIVSARGKRKHGRCSYVHTYILFVNIYIYIYL